jgi:hypothetical protein
MTGQLHTPRKTPDLEITGTRLNSVAAWRSLRKCPRKLYPLSYEDEDEDGAWSEK